MAEALEELLRVFTDLPAARNYGGLVRKCRAAIYAGQQVSNQPRGSGIQSAPVDSAPSAVTAPKLTMELHDRIGGMIDQIGHPDYSLRELGEDLRGVRDDLLRSLSQPASVPAQGETPRMVHRHYYIDGHAAVDEEDLRQIERELAAAKEAYAKLVPVAIEQRERADKLAEAKAYRPSEEAVKLAKEFVADPYQRSKVREQIAANGWPKLATMIDEAVIVSQELLRLHRERSNEEET